MILRPLFLVASICVFGGCSSHKHAPTPEQIVSMVQAADSDSLCLSTIERPDLKWATEAELSKRGATCDWQKVGLMMQARQAQDAEETRLRAIRAQLAQDITRSAQQMTYRPPIQPIQPAPIYNNPPPRQMSCITSYQNNQAITNCQ